jgi:hypothetical protein
MFVQQPVRMSAAAAAAAENVTARKFIFDSPVFYVIFVLFPIDVCVVFKVMIVHHGQFGIG